MAKIEFFHSVPRYTVALELSMTKAELITALQNGGRIKLKVGIAKFNPKDKHFSRKMGREVAVSRLAETSLVVAGIETAYNYEGEKETSNSNIYLVNDKIIIALRAYSGSDKLRLFYSELK